MRNANPSARFFLFHPARSAASPSVFCLLKLLSSGTVESSISRVRVFR
ncbi:MAG: hypothetical protein LBD06_06485 [Candidatus Accumulibacter sp.]|nr:hypothetical protein [Accumulibacter sp.]